MCFKTRRASTRNNTFKAELVKKLEIEKTKTTKYTTFKTVIIKVVLVFGFPTVLLMKIPREKKMSVVWLQ